MSQRWLFVCSCIALVTSAFTFVVHGNVMKDMGATFNFTEAQNGSIGQAIFFGMAGSMFIGGFVCDALGMKNIMILAFLSHIVGSVGMIISQKVAGPGSSISPYTWLYLSGIIMGCGNGLTEVGVNPLVATLFPTKKTHYLNILHAWWPGGLMIGGILAGLVGGGLKLSESIGVPGAGLTWPYALGLIVIPAVVYGIMLLPAKFPVTERVGSGITTGQMLGETKRPMFILWMLCMLLTAATELGPQKWQESVMENTAKISGTAILIYTSGMMFVLRHFAGPIAHAMSPIGMLTVSATLSAVGLYLLSTATDAATAFGYATIFGLGVAYFWPTMLGVAAERFPRGGALILALMGTAGNISIGFALPAIGGLADKYNIEYVQKEGSAYAKQLLKYNGEIPVGLDAQAIEKLPADSEALKIAKGAKSYGFSQAFRAVSVLPAILIVLFSGIFLFDLSRGGYKPEILISPEEENELFAGGAQGPVE